MHVRTVLSRCHHAVATDDAADAADAGSDASFNASDADAYADTDGADVCDAAIAPIG